MLMSNNVEALIISFIAVCAALIVYDIACALQIRHRGARIQRIANSTDTVAAFLRSPRKLRSEKRLRAVELCFDTMLEDAPEQFRTLREDAVSAFSALICAKDGTEDILMAYILFLSVKYRLFYKTEDETLKTALLFMTVKNNLYLRENALHCIYSTGEAELVCRALRHLDSCATEHHRQLLIEGLMHFAGDRQALIDCLTAHFYEFSAEMQSVISAFFLLAGTDGISADTPGTIHLRKEVTRR